MVTDDTVEGEGGYSPPLDRIIYLLDLISEQEISESARRLLQHLKSKGLVLNDVDVDELAAVLLEGLE